VCGESNDPSDRFCGACGAGLATAQPAAAAGSEAGASAPGGASERRLVSVLFADLVGFTTLSELRDPEEVRELLSRYFDRCRALIERYGGGVEKFIGDAVMAVWGTPVAREDDAERAVRAALALTQAVAALGEEVGMPELRVRVGVLTGSAAVDLTAEGEGMVLGDTVNTASRLQSLASPGTVLVDDVTRRASEAAIAYEDFGTHDVKGREQAVHAWTALRVVGGVGGARRSHGLEAPFVGRRAELAHVISVWEDSVGAGVARRVTLVGDAGSGKSRLLWEFFKHTDGLEATFWWHQGRCLAYGEGVGYWPLAEMVRTRAGIAEEEDPGVARAKLRETVERFVADERERRLVEPRLAHLLGLEQRAASDRADLFSGWRLFFERLAATAPVTMVFEDLQWADGGLLDFIDYLLEWSAGFPIFVLGLGRPELVGARPDLTPDVVLTPLADEAMREALEGLVPGLPDELARRILARAEGVPLYAVETVRMLLDRGLLRQEGARYAVTGDVGDLDVPETLHALVAARLDGLQAAERAALQHAAVLGQSFTPAAVAAMEGRPLDEIRAQLDGLVAKQVLSYDDDERSPERGQYRFLQGLLRTIAYGTLSRRDRKALHLAAARHLQEAAGWDGGEAADVLASHFLAAARADPEAADAPKIRASARETLADAGRRALSLALGPEAQRAFDQAAELAEDDATRAELLVQAGRAAALESAEGARPRLDAAIALYEAVGDTQAAARATLVVADVLWTSNELEGAIASAERAFAGLTEDDADRAAAAALLGKLRSFGKDSARALEATDEALRIAEPLQRWDVIADALLTRGATLAMLYRAEEGLALTMRGTDLAVEHDLPGLEMRGHNNLGWIAHRADRLEASRRNQLRCLELGRALGERMWIRQTQGSYAAVRAEQGDWDAGEERAAALSETPAAESVVLDSEVLLPLAVIRSARGEIDALMTVERQAEFGAQSRDEQVRECCVIAQGVARAGRGAHEEAIALLEPLLTGTVTTYHQLAISTYLESALALGRDDLVAAGVAVVRTLPAAVATPTIRGYADRFEGLLAARAGDAAQAGALLTRAAATLRPAGRPFPLAKVLLEQAELLVAAGDPEAAEPLLREAREIFAELRAGPYSRRVEQAAAAPAEPARA
jgi:class 3 adenylate cyclase/tetratricopeptide (TPR) repeat protein